MELLSYFLDNLWLGKPVWMWLTFVGIVIVLLALDLGVLHRLALLVANHPAADETFCSQHERGAGGLLTGLVFERGRGAGPPLRAGRVQSVAAAWQPFDAEVPIRIA